jgi:hypothetical protein
MCCQLTTVHPLKGFAILKCHVSPQDPILRTSSDATRKGNDRIYRMIEWKSLRSEKQHLAWENTGHATAMETADVIWSGGHQYGLRTVVGSGGQGALLIFFFLYGAAAQLESWPRPPGIAIFCRPSPVLLFRHPNPNSLAKVFVTAWFPFRGFGRSIVSNIFDGVGLLASRPTLNMEDQGIPFCLGHHHWPVWHRRPYQ